MSKKLASLSRVWKGKFDGFVHITQAVWDGPFRTGTEGVALCGPCEWDHHKEATASEIFKNWVEKVFHGDDSPRVWLLDLWTDSPHGEERKRCLREIRWLPSLHWPSDMLMCWLTTSKASNEDRIYLFHRTISNHRMAAYPAEDLLSYHFFHCDKLALDLLWLFFLATKVSSNPLSR